MSLKRQLLWNMSPLLVISVVNIVSVPLFLRFLGDEMYALTAYVATYSAMFGFADLGLGVAVGRYMGVALGKDDQVAAREYWATGNFIVLPLVGATALVFMVLGVFFVPPWVNIAPENVALLRGCFVAGSVAIFLAYYTQLWSILMQVYLNFRLVSIVRTVGTLSQVIPALVIAWATKNPLWITLWGLVVSVAQLAVYVWYAHRHYGLGFDLRSARRARAREMAGFTAKIFTNLFAGGMLSTIDRVILSPLASASDFTRYNVASNVGTRLQGLGGAVMPPVFHNTALAAGRGQPDSARAIFGEMFDFTFGWYVLASVWAVVWHPVFLHLWLGAKMGAAVAPLFTPLIIAYCLGALANVSGSQLSGLGRAGAALGFSIATGAAAAAGAWLGWRVNGAVGVAYGFLASRLVCVAQDIFTARLVGASGWLSARLWLGVLAQCAFGGAFALVYLVIPHDSFWLLVPAIFHGGLVAAWLLRHPLRRFVGGWARFGSARIAPAGKGAPEP